MLCFYLVVNRFIYIWRLNCLIFPQNESALFSKDQMKESRVTILHLLLPVSNEGKDFGDLNYLRLKPVMSLSIIWTCKICVWGFISTFVNWMITWLRSDEQCMWCTVAWIYTLLFHFDYLWILLVGGGGVNVLPLENPSILAHLLYCLCLHDPTCAVVSNVLNFNICMNIFYVFMYHVSYLLLQN